MDIVSEPFYIHQFPHGIFGHGFTYSEAHRAIYSCGGATNETFYSGDIQSKNFHLLLLESCKIAMRVKYCAFLVLKAVYLKGWSSVGN
jgi:hypothetical protein